MSRALLSVAIPTRDTVDLTVACLRSLHDHGVPGLEIVVVDDAGTDGTDRVVRSRFPAVRLVRNPKPLGFTASANRGLEAAGGDRVLLLNSDTEVGPGSLRALLDAFDADPRLGIAGALLSYPDGREQWSGGAEPGGLWMFLQASGFGPLVGKLPVRRRPSRPTETDGEPEPTRPVDWVTGAALTVRRDVLDRIGPLDERFSFYAQDLDFCLRAGDAGWTVGIVPGFRVVHHHGSSISRVRRTVGAQQLELLWRDLVLLAGKRHGDAGRRSARRALLGGGCVRLLGRWAATPFVLPLRGAGWLRETAASRRALASLRAAS